MVAVRTVREASMFDTWVRAGMVASVAVLLGGCGYTDYEMAAKQRQIDALVAEVDALKAAAATTHDKGVKQATPSRPIVSSR
jgi:hypothetical protein